jgi:hypothetical protein
MPENTTWTCWNCAVRLEAEPKEVPMTGRCPHCGWSDADPFHVLSRHHTVDGLTTWVRCACGSLQVWLLDAAGARLLLRGRPDLAEEVHR